MSGRAREQEKRRRHPGAKSSFKLSAAEKERFFSAAGEFIEDLIKKGVTEGLTGIPEPRKEHYPDLLNVGEYKNFLKGTKKYDLDRKLMGRGECEGVRSAINVSSEDVTPEKIEVKDILKGVIAPDGCTKDCKKLMIAGSAGMGKTTLLRRLANHSREKGKLVIFANFRSVPKDKKITPAAALLSYLSSNMDAEELKQRYQWMKENSEKVVIIMDSLDTMPFDLEDERQHISHDEEATIDVIAHNLLSGNLLASSTVIWSSREFKVRKLHASIQPDRCIIIDGLKEESVKELLVEMLGRDKAAAIEMHIETECPEIWSLLTVPVFLIFAVVLFESGQAFVLKNMSGILVGVFTCLLRSEHARGRNVISIFQKLMPICLEAIREARVNFTPEEFWDIGVDPADAVNLGILIPQGQGSYKLMHDDHFFLYFNHQTQQECLAALSVLSMKKQEFKAFIQLEFLRPNLIVVSRIIGGVLLNDAVLQAALDLVEIPDVDEKREILLKRLEAALKEDHTEDRWLLDVYTIFNEGKGGVRHLIRSTVRKISFFRDHLTLSDIQAIAFVMKQCEHLDKVGLFECDINHRKVEIIEKAVMQSDVKINKLDIACNDIGVEGMSSLARIVNHCGTKIVCASQCKITGNGVEFFFNNASGMKFEGLDVSSNEEIDPTGWEKIGYMMEDGSSLIASNSNLNSEKIQKLHEGLGAKQLKVLEVRYNKEIDLTGYKRIGNIMKDHAETLDISFNDVNIEKMQKLLQGLGGKHVDVLLLWNDLPKPLYDHASLLDIIPYVDKALNIRGWRVDETEKRDIQNKLNEIGSPILIFYHGGLMEELEELSAYPIYHRWTEKDPLEEPSTTVAFLQPTASPSVQSFAELKEEPPDDASTSAGSLTLTAVPMEDKAKRGLTISDDPEGGPSRKRQKSRLFSMTDTESTRDPFGVADSSKASQEEVEPDSDSDEMMMEEQKLLVESDSDEDGFLQRERVTSEDEETVTPLQRALEDALKKKVYKRQEFSPQGGSMEHYGSKLILPQEAIVENTILDIFVDSNLKSIPISFLPISLIFGCKPFWFQKNITVQLVCCLKPNEGDHTRVVILMQPDNKPDWKPFTEAILSESGVVEFEVPHFCQLVAAIKKEDVPKYKCLRFFHDVWMRYGNTKVLSCLHRDKTSLKENTKELSASDYYRVGALPREQLLYIGGRIKLNIHCKRRHEIEPERESTSATRNPSPLKMNVVGTDTIKITENTLLKSFTSREFEPTIDPKTLCPDDFSLYFTADVFDPLGKRDEEESISFRLDYKPPSSRSVDREVEDQHPVEDPAAVGALPENSGGTHVNIQSLHVHGDANIATKDQKIENEHIHKDNETTVAKDTDSGNNSVYNISVNAPVGQFVAPNATNKNAAPISNCVAGLQAEQICDQSIIAGTIQHREEI